MAGNYLIRNSDASRRFLLQWAQLQFVEPRRPAFSNADNGALHLILVQTLLPQLHDVNQNLARLWNDSNVPGKSTYGRYVATAQNTLKSHILRPESGSPRIKILHRAQAWARDTEISQEYWWDGDFMTHGMKHPKLRPFLSRVAYSASECSDPSWTPSIDKNLHISEDAMRSKLQEAKGFVQRMAPEAPHFVDNIDRCWPQCPPLMDPRNYGIKSGIQALQEAGLPA